ncbi:hypothetical protein [Streptomyces sp. A0592]|uniref:hypothetical protein n=1 Tax=Streptomyces sp. A0592 TaxID=2563099 RepID=UPI00109EAA7B|nr:hypothetical protein [Streptomyces sp. A0592]THA86538.1 hypothetical protein E6U81_00015 [Streptomyces sp. A0592]
MPATKDRAGRSRVTPRPFALWREVLTAYAAPALTAGAAAVATGQRDLAAAAVTSIAGTSALAALVVGAWLRSGGRPRRWTTDLPRVVVAVVLVVAATGAAALLGWCAALWLPAHSLAPAGLRPERLRIDLPVSAALATAVVTLRWRSAFARWHPDPPAREDTR